MTIGERIKQRRDELGITQTALADAVGTTKQNIYKYENGIITNIPSDKIEAIAVALCTSPAALMGWNDSQSDSPAPAVSPDDIKAAFWGGDKDLSKEDLDAMWADVKNFADFVAQKKKQEKQRHD